MKRFTFAKLVKMGEMDPKYGQTYWGETNEQLEPVKFNSMNENINDADTIEAEEILLKTSAKGIDYHQLKKVKVVGSQGGGQISAPQATNEVQNPALANQPTNSYRADPTPSDNQILKDQLDSIEEKLDQLLDIQERAKEILETPDFLRPEGE